MKPKRAKLFQNGGSQAVRLPKDCRFVEQTEVLVRREGRRVILEPVDEWSAEFLSCLGSVKKDIPRPGQPRLSRMRNPFD
jgi:antitoxin VapB